MQNLTRNNTLALSVCLLSAAWHPPALALSATATAFDRHVAIGLPQAFALPRQADDEHGPGIDQVVIEERLKTDVAYPDGSHATTYIGRANGQEAVFTRLGEVLSVSVLDAPRATVATSHAVPPAPEGDDAILPTSMRPALADPRPAGTPQAELHFWIFLHDQAGESNYAKFHNWYIAWWIYDMEQTVTPGVPVKITIKDHLPGVTDFDYREGRAEDSLLSFRNAADSYLYRMGFSPSSLTKVMLFVGARPGNWGGAYGMALIRDTVAMASGTGPRHGVAHEFGHTMDARHEHAQTRFPCVTNMSAYTIGLSSCRIYSGENDLKIREYVRQTIERESDH